MDSIFAKTVIFVASILTVLNGPNYIGVNSESLSFDFKTGQNFPIYYYLNVQNVGPGTERFEISSNQSWVSVYREGTSYDFVELPAQAYMNFILEVHPERLADGVNETKVKLRVLDIDSLVSQEVVLDETNVSITLNKNIVPIPTLNPTIVASPSSSLMPTLSPTISATPIPTSVPHLVPPDLNLILKQIQSIVDSIRSLLEKLF